MHSKMRDWHFPIISRGSVSATGDVIVTSLYVLTSCNIKRFPGWLIFCNCTENKFRRGFKTHTEIYINFMVIRSWWMLIIGF